MKGLPSQAQMVPAPTIEPIADYRVADGGEVDPDLMGPTGLQGQGEEAVIPEVLKDIINGNCYPTGGDNGHFFTVERMPADGHLDHAFPGLGYPVDDGQISPVHRPVF